MIRFIRLFVFHLVVVICADAVLMIYDHKVEPESELAQEG